MKNPGSAWPISSARRARTRSYSPAAHPRALIWSRKLGAEKFSAPSLRDQINALGCAAGEYDRVSARRADEIGHALPGFFIMLGRARAQCVQAAMHVGVFMFVITSDNIEDGARLLGGGGVVEVNQWMAVDALPQNWKILAKRGPIHATYGRLVHEIICSNPWLAPLYSQAARIDIRTTSDLRSVP